VGSYRYHVSECILIFNARILLIIITIDAETPSFHKQITESLTTNLGQVAALNSDGTKNILAKSLLERTHSAIPRKTSTSRCGIAKHSTFSETTDAGRCEDVVGRGIVSAKDSVIETASISVDRAV
jgi:hypothetical protein